jgi:hypothetical protein
MSVRMIQATGSLDLLLLAAQSRFDGQPSWVLDWSGDFSSFWKDNPIDVNPVTLRQPEADVRERVNRHPNPDMNLFWRWAPEKSDILTVRGCNFQCIVSCLKFARATDHDLVHETANSHSLHYRPKL